MSKILVDADACPVKAIIEEVAQKYALKVIMFIDTSHILDSSYSEVVVVSRQKDAVDFAIVNRLEKNDIVVTQDYGVAAMCLSKQAFILNQNGLVFNDGNMDRLLFERHISQKIRRSGGRTPSHKKRSGDDDAKFRTSLERLCSWLVNS